MLIAVTKVEQIIVALLDASENEEDRYAHLARWLGEEIKDEPFDKKIILPLEAHDAALIIDALLAAGEDL